MKSIIYARVSSDEQLIDTQVDDLKQFCKDKNIELGHTPFKDKITGATKGKDRPEFDKMITFLIKNQDVKQVLCWEYSRLGRSFVDTYNIIEEFRNSGINVYFKKENLNTINCTAQEQFTLNILASIAEYERDQIKERTKRGREHSVKSGNVAGAAFPTFGYTKDNKELIIDKDEARLVKRIFNMYVEKDMTSTQIANILNAEGEKPKYAKHVESGKIELKSKRLKKTKYRWTSMTVCNVLKKKIVIGVRVWNNEEFPYNSKLRIVSDELYYAANEKLRNNKLTSANAQKYPNVLKGCIKCAYCDSGYMMHRGNPRVSKANTYKCYFKQDKENRCQSPEINIDLLNNVVYFFLQNAVRDDDKLAEQITQKQMLIDANERIVADLNKLNAAESEKLTALYRDKYDPTISEASKASIHELELEFNKNIESNNQEVRRLGKESFRLKAEIEHLENDESLLLSNPEIFKRYAKNVINQIQVRKLDNSDILKQLFPNRRKGYVYDVIIDAGVYGGWELLCAKGFEYFYQLIGNCFKGREYHYKEVESKYVHDDGTTDDYIFQQECGIKEFGEFIGGRMSEHSVEDEETGIVTQVEEIIPMYIKVPLKYLINIDQ